MSMQAHGTARKFGDHVDTDVIIPARYLASQDPKELASHCMEDIDAAFVQNQQRGRPNGRRVELRLRLLA